MSSSERINFKIKMPSVGFTQFLRKVISDKDTYDLFMENPVDVLKSHGVNLDESVNNEALAKLKLIIFRIHNFLQSEKETVATKRFEELFSLETPESLFNKTIKFNEKGLRIIDRPKDLDVAHEIKINADIGVDGYSNDPADFADRAFSDTSSSWVIGSETKFDSVFSLFSSESKSSWLFSFGGKFNESDGIQKAPLLDAVTLNRILTEFDVKLKKFGKY